MDIKFEYKPLPAYEEFHATVADERLMVGGFGSGKTWALCAEALAVGLEQPGSRIMITRRTIPALKDTTEAEFVSTMPTALIDRSEFRRGGGHIQSIILPNGTVYLFKSIDDWKKHKSLNLAWIFWDELNEFDEETYLGMQGRLRQTQITPEARARGIQGAITRTGMCAATNPEGHDWVWKRFVKDGGKQGTRYWKATTLDNPTLAVSFVQKLLRYPEPWVRRYVLCEFDDFSGAVYGDWNYDTHVLKEKIHLPANARIVQGFDPGMRHPTAALWCWDDVTNDRYVGIAEYLHTDLSVAKHTAHFRRIEGSLPPVWARVADPSVQKRDWGSARTLRDQYHAKGFQFRLGPSRQEDRVPMLGALIAEKKLVLLPHLTKTFEQIRDYRWKDLTPTQRANGERAKEQIYSKDDDLVDTAQYIASLRTPSMRQIRRKRPKTQQEAFAQQIWSEERRRREQDMVRSRGYSGNILE